MPLKTPEQIASAYMAKLLPIAGAAKMFGMSKSTFLRLRQKHGVNSLPGQRVHIADIVSAMEKERLEKKRQGEVSQDT